ncbi:MAG: putative rane protein [Gemmatimonadetes bacterium]|nr:putative rane protein [Gemmatimonadota bacterium]
MAVQTTFPGVYIDEFAPGAPIEGVGTSTPAFIGIATTGDLDAPTKLTSWQQFRQIFGEEPRPGFFLWYAVRGFFENGGQVCYVVRASNGTYDRFGIRDRSGVATSFVLTARARQPGVSGITINAAVAHLLPITSTAFRAPASTVLLASARDITLNAGQGAAFRPTDRVDIAGVPETLDITRVSGDRLTLANAPSAVPAVGAAVRLADVAIGARSIRIRPGIPILPANALVAGTVLTIDASAQVGGGTWTGVVDSVQAELLGPGNTTYRVTFRQPSGIGFTMAAGDPAVTVESQEFDLTVLQGASTRTYAGLSLESIHPAFYRTLINDDPASLVVVERVDPPPPLALPLSLPDTFGAVAVAPAGVAENVATMTDGDFIDAIDTLRMVDDVNLLAVPDCLTGIPGVTTANVQQAMIAHCEQLGDRFAVLDSEPGAPLFDTPATPGVETQRRGVDSTRGYAALYYPWLRVRPATTGEPILVPPSGHVCGIIARSDNTRGVHKAPANELVNGAMGVERTMSDVDQGQLNVQGINVLRVFSNGGRVMLWGARTTATDTNWRYVNIRRLFLYLEESIAEGIRWAVFEPNNLGLWQKLRRTINEFLTRAWRDGALFGASAEDAFYVRIDETLNPDATRALGRLYIEIGVRPSYPAEFIIVRIGIWAGGSAVAEG